MKRTGFTMIELIFVIVILGILSAVAIPKMMNTSAQAKASNCKSFFATMNNSVGPSLWSNMAIDGQAVDVAFTADTIQAQIDIPADCGISLAEVAQGAIDGTGKSTTIDNVNYDMNATAATTSLAPSWTWKRQ
jgi:prepilin-type N-terminal cleavage/methylation domain-containing protein